MRHEIGHNVKTIFENFSNENFLFNLLLAYGISKTSITFAFFQPHKARQKNEKSYQANAQQND